MQSHAATVVPRRTFPARVAAILALTLSAAAAVAEPLENAIRTALEHAKLGKCKVGVAVYDCTTEESLASIEASKSYAPASNLKLITSGVALSVLGEKFEFKTHFIAQGNKLIIKGGGDPGLCDPKLLAAQNSTVEQFIARIVDAAKLSGASGINEIIIDDRVFAQEGVKPGVHPNWPGNQLNKWYCAPVTGLNFFTNVLEIRAKPGERLGMRPEIITEPRAPWLINLDVAARTTKEGATSLWAAQVESNPGFLFRVDGSIRDTVKEPIEVTVNQPGQLFANLVAAQLRDAKLTENGKLPAVRFVNELEELKAEENRAFAVISTPIDVALRRCNTDSQNLYAECLLKRLAFEVTQQPGRWETGGQVVRMRMSEKLGQELGNIQIVDGSGLSSKNLITPNVMVRWLGAMHADKALFGTYLESMARADDRKGKLYERFKDRKPYNIIYAKTGLINGVRCLSGYVVSQDAKHCIAYSVLVNDTEGTPAIRIMDFQEDVATIIDRHIGKTAPAQPDLGG